MRLVAYLGSAISFGAVMLIITLPLPLIVQIYISVLFGIISALPYVLLIITGQLADIYAQVLNELNLAVVENILNIGGDYDFPTE